MPLRQGAKIPKFTGAYAGEFERAYKSSTSDLQRDVLRDGRISDREMAALNDAFAQCLRGYGYTNVRFLDDGGFSFSVPKGVTDDEQSEVVGRCQDATLGPDPIDMIYYGEQRKPGNEDEATVMAACFVREGLAPQGYSRSDYLRDSPAGTLPFDTNDKRFDDCIDDPLHAGE